MQKIEGHFDSLILSFPITEDQVEFGRRMSAFHFVCIFVGLAVTSDSLSGGFQFLWFVGFCALDYSEVKDAVLRMVDVCEWMINEQSVGGLWELEVSSSQQRIVDEVGCKLVDHSLHLTKCFVKETN